MSDNMPLGEWIKRFQSGAFDKPDINTQIEAGWYDWFCDDRSLAKKTQKLGDIVMRLSHSKLLDHNKHYVWFKNNCPCYGRLYDDIRFADMETGQTLYVVCPRVGYDKWEGGRSVVADINKDAGEDTVKGTMRDVYRYFGV